MPQGAFLLNRGVLRITGKDRIPFLQGLVTNDVRKITQGQAIYAALLSPQGKFQYDFFIVACQNQNGEEAWLIDCERDRADMLLKRLSLYKLRSEVTIENISEQWKVLALFGPQVFAEVGFSEQLGAAQSIKDGVVFTDPRLQEMGMRSILPVDQADLFFENQGIHIVNFEAYDLHRLRQGIPYGSREVGIDRGILLECGFDELNAIDWNKGCYMGQELTARTRYRGLVRKRLIPVNIQGEAAALETPILQGEADVGDIRTTLQGWGMAMIRLEALSKPSPLTWGEATLTAHVPHWMRLPSFHGKV